MNQEVGTPSETRMSDSEFDRRIALVSGVLGLLLTLAGLAEKVSNLGLWILSNVLLYLGIPLVVLFVASHAIGFPRARELTAGILKVNNKWIQALAPTLTLLAILVASILIAVKIDLLNVQNTAYVDEVPQNIDEINKLIDRTNARS